MSQMVDVVVTELSLEEAQALAAKTREDLNLAIDARLEIDKQIKLASERDLDYGHLITEHAKLTCRIKKLGTALAEANQRIEKLEPLRGLR